MTLPPQTLLTNLVYLLNKIRLLPRGLGPLDVVSFEVRPKVGDLRVNRRPREPRLRPIPDPLPLPVEIELKFPLVVPVPLVSGVGVALAPYGKLLVGPLRPGVEPLGRPLPLVVGRGPVREMFVLVFDEVGIVATLW